MKRLYILTICTVGLAVSIFLLNSREPTIITVGEGLVAPKQWLTQNKKPVTHWRYVRPANQTFLTFPEWYLVFSPEEQATYYKYHTSTSFPFMEHTAQIWECYDVINNQVKDNYEPNPGYHFMIWVIGTSATVEYSVKAWYETIVGRVTDTEIPCTDEDKFNRRFTQEYVNFIKDIPWYEFDFASRLCELWTSTSFVGDNFLRKLERKYILTSELMVKLLYGKLIAFGAGQVYDEAPMTTAVLLQNDSLYQLHRYDKFAKEAVVLANAGYSFKEIAGNNSAILFSVIVPELKRIEFPSAKTIFIQPITSDRSKKRVAIVTPVSNLATLLKQCDTEGIYVEHVFDY